MEQTVLELIQKQKAFDAFVEENMKTSTYKIAWTSEMAVEYEASKTYQAMTAEYAGAMLGTVLDKHSARPKHDAPSIGELQGALVRMGDEWQLDNDRLERYYLMERRLRDKAKNLTTEQRAGEYSKIVKYLFDSYEKAAIAPHRRIWAMYLEGLSNGEITLTKTNNSGGIVWSAAISTGISKKNLRSTDVVWSTATLSTMNVLKVLQYAEDLADAAGKTVIEHRISKATASLITQCDQFKNLLGMNLGKLQTLSSPVLSLDVINNYLTSVQLAPLKVVNEKGVLKNGTVTNLFTDGRLVSMCAPRVAVLKVSDPLEMVDPVPNKMYTTYNDNLISQYRNEQGRYVAYEMWAFPAFTGNKDVFILDVTQKD